jgi:hypothetical protein
MTNNSEFPNLSKVVTIPTRDQVTLVGDALKMSSVETVSFVGVGEKPETRLAEVQSLLVSIGNSISKESIQDALAGLAGVTSSKGNASEITAQSVPAGKPTGNAPSKA